MGDAGAIFTVNNVTQPPWTGDEEITYDEVVDIAFPDGQKDRVDYTVTWSNGPRNSPTGSLDKGGKVKLVDGMSFTVSHTANV